MDGWMGEGLHLVDERDKVEVDLPTRPLILLVVLKVDLKRDEMDEIMWTRSRVHPATDQVVVDEDEISGLPHSKFAELLEVALKIAHSLYSSWQLHTSMIQRSLALSTRWPGGLTADGRRERCFVTGDWSIASRFRGLFYKVSTQTHVRIGYLHAGGGREMSG